MDESRISQCLYRASDALSLVESGLDGLLGLIADGPTKTLSMRRDSLFYAIEPQHVRLKEAIADIDALRKEMRNGTP